LVGDNDSFSFAHFNAGEVFGETDVLCDINRNGTAVTIEHSTLYTIKMDSFIAIIINFPENHHSLVKNALQKNR
jgi:CRP-like cAMP-binding protein